MGEGGSLWPYGQFRIYYRVSVAAAHFLNFPSSLASLSDPSVPCWDSGLGPKNGVSF